MWQHVSNLITRREVGEWQQREQELAKVYGVPHAEVDLANPWCPIALRLAVEHVPGFRYPTRKGDAIRRPGRGGNPKLTKEQTKTLARLVAQAWEAGKRQDGGDRCIHSRPEGPEDVREEELMVRTPYS